MKDTKKHNSRINAAASLADQIAAMLCGVLIPRLMIGAYGSALYGAVTSAAQFLSFVSLLEGGIGRTARAALYGRLAGNDRLGVSRIYHGVRKLFCGIGVGFVVYALVLALSFFDIARVEQLSRGQTAVLVALIAVGTAAEYFLGITNMTLIHADQRKYVVSLALMVSRIAAAVLTVGMIAVGCDLLQVKAAAAAVAVMRGIYFAVYVRRNYDMVHVPKKEAVLEHKWDGIGQHLAYFLHTNTDMVLLTLFSDLQTVAVYAVYSMIAVTLRNVTAALAGGMEAQLGDLIARRRGGLRQTYWRYQCILTTAALALFATAAVLAVPFVRLYTQGVTDTQYIRPGFALLLLLGEAVNCIALPASTLPVSANMLKNTRGGAYGEAAVNVVVSCALMALDPLLGVAAGTLCAQLYKGIYYLCYAQRKILKERILPELLRFLAAILILAAAAAAGMELMEGICIENYWQWVLWAVPVTAAMTVIAAAARLVLYPKARKQEE